jgi:hypothetical protein
MKKLVEKLEVMTANSCSAVIFAMILFLENIMAIRLLF